MSRTPLQSCPNLAGGTPSFKLLDLRLLVRAVSSRARALSKPSSERRSQDIDNSGSPKLLQFQVPNSVDITVVTTNRNAPDLHGRRSLELNLSTNRRGRLQTSTWACLGVGSRPREMPRQVPGQATSVASWQWLAAARSKSTSYYQQP